MNSGHFGVMAILGRVGIVAATIGVLAFGASAARAQDSGAQEPAQEQQEDPNKDFVVGWKKVAVPNPEDASRPITLVSNEARNANNITIAEVTIVMEPDKEKRMLVVVPEGALLPPGIRLQVDQNEPIPGQYITCVGNNCQAEAKITDEFITQMKKGANLIVAVATLPEGRPQGVGLTLTGFTAAFDGEPLDLEKYKAERQTFKDLLQRRAEENRRRMQEQQQQSNGGDGEQAQ